MARSFAVWLAAVLVLFAVFVLSKGNVGWLLWAIAGWWVVGTLWRIMQSRRTRPVDAETTSPSPREEGNQFDPEFCGRILRIAAICFVAMVALEFILFSTVNSTKCPGWQGPNEKGSGGAWAILVLAAIWTLNISYHAVTWRHSSREILDQIAWARRTYVPGTNPTWLTDRTQFKAMCTLKNNMNTLIILALVGSAFFVALPVLTHISCF